MAKVNKLYKKAMDSYCDGKLDKAKAYCDKALVIDRRHSATLNLMGLIYYVRGDLEKAKNSWKLNYKINGNKVSKKYLEDSRKDEADIFMYSKGVSLLDELKVKQALDCFLKCESSYFNSLNLWNNIAKCYMQLGKYEKSVRYVEDILKLDVDNKEAIKLKKELIDLGFMDKESGDILKKIVLGAACILVVGLVVFAGYKGVSATKQWIDSKKVEDASKNEEVSSNEEKISSNEEEVSLDNFQGNNNQSEEIPAFNVDELKKYMENKDFENIIKYIGKYDVDSLNLNDKKVVKQAQDLVSKEGTLTLYNKGTEFMNSKEYKNAINEFELIYQYSEGIYLKEHILFMMASAYDNIGDIEKSNEYYEKYAADYLKDGAYIGQCLYSLAMNNNGINDELSKKYAAMLKDNCSKSEYYNNNIKSILGN